MEYYIYALKDPRTNLPFYIGKGQGNRCYVHLKETYKRTENKKKYAYIKGLGNKGLEPIVEKIKENLTEQEAYCLEASLIQQYGRKGIDIGGILTNICIDNRPPNLKGRIVSEATKEKIRKTKIGSKNPMFGKSMSEEQKQLIRNKMIGELNPFYGKTHTADQVAKWKTMKRGMTGKHQSEETKEKIRQAVTGYKHSKEAIQKIKEARAKQMFSPETLYKKSESMKLLWQNKKAK